MAEVLHLSKCLVEPNNCTFDQAMCITLEFECKGIADATWEVQYEADYTNKRHVIPLCTVGPISFEPGVHTVDLKIPPINTEGVKERRLLSMGILKCILLSGKEEVSSVNFVTQVSRNEAGELIRLLMSPLE
ncbi:hypothetical protein DIPPA_32736 [Diplonema papillatum]|nr:hypothetical protein DIPPA_32736 [Diplonema papillatum]